jgi:hypothetical protein
MSFSIPLFADGSGGVPAVPDSNPCGFGDWGVTYRVTISRPCSRVVYDVTCGGAFGNEMISVVVVSIWVAPICGNF